MLFDRLLILDIKYATRFCNLWHNSLKEELEGQEKEASSILEFRYIYGIDEVER